MSGQCGAIPKHSSCVACHDSHVGKPIGMAIYCIFHHQNGKSSTSTNFRITTVTTVLGTTNITQVLQTPAMCLGLFDFIKTSLNPELQNPDSPPSQPLKNHLKSFYTDRIPSHQSSTILEFPLWHRFERGRRALR